MESSADPTLSNVYRVAQEGVPLGTSAKVGQPLSLGPWVMLATSWGSKRFHQSGFISALAMNFVCVLQTD